MSISYTTCRILCSTPADLDEEQQLFLTATAEFGEQVTIPNQILFAVASFREPFEPHSHRYAVQGNLRMVDFFVHIYGERAPEPIYQDFVYYGLKCLADPAKPLRRAVVFFKSPGVDETLRGYRGTLAADERCQVRVYNDAKDLAAQFREMLQDWYATVPAKSSTAQSSAGV
ncbi:MAG TPA: hypothetical protein VGZ73_08870 [Bryobacteraceae bacterium]|jgi:hypothetical protein|nr:hypothetical protein [Bryobacteraceae bacterium]